jgi:hypothetical protein
MDSREERIRVRAYEIWERQGRSGSPEDHWLEAERELKAEEPTKAASDRSEATVEEASPVQAVEALEAATDAPATSKRHRESSEG